jgi:hypothetical protein
MRKRILLAWLLVITAIAAHYKFDPWGFYWKVSPEEALQRTNLISAAESWLGVGEADGSHIAVLDVYNSHEPLAQGYEVKYTDEWCATFVSAIAISYGITDIIPTECGCQRQIALFQSMGVWVENDDYKPYPGDIIYYCREDSGQGDCTGWSDHVGIVVGTAGPFMKVIEGNYNDAVAYRYLPLDSSGIRGFAVPDFRSHSE